MGRGELCLWRHSEPVEHAAYLWRLKLRRRRGRLCAALAWDCCLRLSVHVRTTLGA